MHGPLQREAYLASHAEVDMILDTFPFPGGTTTCEALWMRMPTLSLAGDRLIGLQGASVLAAAGLNDWVTRTPAEYVDEAIARARDQLRQALRRRRVDDVATERKSVRLAAWPRDQLIDGRVATPRCRWPLAKRGVGS